MRCSKCDAPIRDDQAAFCPRCGNALGAPDAEATVELGHEPAGGTREMPRDAVEDASPGARISDLAGSVSRSAASAGWARATKVAFFGLLTAVALGALLVLGAKLQYPSVGASAGPFQGLEVMVMAGLAVLGAPVAIGDLSLSALPIGALAVVAWAIVWATRRELLGAGAGDVRAAVVAGAKTAIPLALMCLASAAFFRIGEGPSPISIDPIAAFFVGGLWGAVFGALGGWLAATDLRSRTREVAGSLGERSRLVLEGLTSAALMLATSAVLGIFCALLWAIVVLARGPDGFGWGEALASLVYMSAFAPNIVVSVVSTALGAPVDVGAQVTVGGRVLGPLQEVSLFSGDLPWLAFGLLAIPVIACFVGGYSARRTTSIVEQGVGVLGVAAFAYAFVLADLAVLADARLGSGLVRNRGFALIAPNAILVFLMALAWAAVLGYLGWWYAERTSPRGAASDIAGVSAPENARAAV